MLHMLQYLPTWRIINPSAGFQLLKPCHDLPSYFRFGKLRHQQATWQDTSSRSQLLLLLLLKSHDWQGLAMYEWPKTPSLPCWMFLWPWMFPHMEVFIGCYSLLTMDVSFPGCWGLHCRGLSNIKRPPNSNGTIDISEKPTNSNVTQKSRKRLSGLSS